MSDPEPMNMRMFFDTTSGRWFLRGFGFGGSGETPEEAMRDLVRVRNTTEKPAWPVKHDPAPDLYALLKEVYSAVPRTHLGSSRCVDYDPAGSTYEFTEYEWSRKIRLLLGYKYEPTGV